MTTTPPPLRGPAKGEESGRPEDKMARFRLTSGLLKVNPEEICQKKGRISA